MVLIPTGDGGNSKAARVTATRSRALPLLMTDYTIVCDSSEGYPYGFRDIVREKRRVMVKTIRRKLETGDYAIDGYEHLTCVERKEFSDLLGCLTHDRARFEREHQRMAGIIARGGFAVVVVEAALGEIETQQISKVTSASVLGTQAAWFVRYGVPWLWCSDRLLAEETCWQLLDMWWRHNKETTNDPVTDIRRTQRDQPSTVRFS
jgi:DNA excision repair protein ERCC-4